MFQPEWENAGNDSDDENCCSGSTVTENGCCKKDGTEEKEDQEHDEKTVRRDYIVCFLPFPIIIIKTDFRSCGICADFWISSVGVEDS